MRHTKSKRARNVLIVLILIILILCSCLLLQRRRNTLNGLPNVNDLPKTTGEKVGKTVATSFLTLSQEINGPVPFLYVYDPATGQDRLMVFQLPKILFPSIEPTDNENYWLANSEVSLATIFEPNWGGLQGLAATLNMEKFNAKVINTVYVSRIETGNVLSETYSAKFHSEEIICPTEQLPATRNNGLQIYVGQISQHKPENHHIKYWTELENGAYVYLIGNTAENESPAFQEAVSPFYAIVKRYNLYSYLLNLGM